MPWLGVAPCGRATGASRACWRWGHPPPRRRPNRVPGANGPQRAVLDAEQDVVTPVLVVVTLGADLVLVLTAAWVVDVYSEYFSSVRDLQVRRYNSLGVTFGETVLTNDFREEDFSGVPRPTSASMSSLYSRRRRPRTSALPSERTWPLLNFASLTMRTSRGLWRSWRVSRACSEGRQPTPPSTVSPRSWRRCPAPYRP